MNAEKTLEHDHRISNLEKMMETLVSEMREDRKEHSRNTKAVTELAVESSASRKLVEGMLTELKEMRKTQGELVTRVTVIESDGKGFEMVKRAFIGSVVSLLIAGAVYGYFSKGG